MHEAILIYSGIVVVLAICYVLLIAWIYRLAREREHDLGTNSEITGPLPSNVPFTVLIEQDDQQAAALLESIAKQRNVEVSISDRRDRNTTDQRTCP